MSRMEEPLLSLFRHSLPDEILQLVEPSLSRVENAQFGELLRESEARLLFGHEQISGVTDETFDASQPWSDYIFHRLGLLLADRSKHEKPAVFFCIGYAALLAFLQSNVTGPPLTFISPDLLFPPRLAKDKAKVREARQALLASFGIDGIGPYKLTPNIELLSLADAVMTNPAVLKSVPATSWAKLRVEFVHQRLLSEVSQTLQNIIYDDLKLVQQQVFGGQKGLAIGTENQAQFLVEKATIHIHHGLDEFARSDLMEAAHKRNFDFALTGLLGKRTRYQHTDISQLVVLAKSKPKVEARACSVKVISGQRTGHKFSQSNEHGDDESTQPPLKQSATSSKQPEDSPYNLSHQESAFPTSNNRVEAFTPGNQTQLQLLSGETTSDRRQPDSEGAADRTTKLDPLQHERATASAPQNLNLNDDTLLEAISFAKEQSASISIKGVDSLPSSLAALDPSDQPQLDSVDSAILLSLASSITNTSPADGLTREETLPYATRVLEGGSSNWQVYSQALLVRSRIEGYKSRTIERGLLQLQALVDQVIAETSSSEAGQTFGGAKNPQPTFLPRAKETEAAPTSERLRYVFLLATPTRWDMEAELANRWIQLGGLRSALGIYERLEMWAEAALCLAATEREDKAREIVRKQLFHSGTEGQVSDGTLDAYSAEEEKWDGPARDPPPLDAPRLYCILGDIDQSVCMWERAWEVSNQRYARAQRSLGRYYLTTKDNEKAAVAYRKGLAANQLHHGSWFALGCVSLNLSEFEQAAEAFSRCVQLDDTDAEAWSNLAAALLKMEPSENARHSSIPEPGHAGSDITPVPLAARSSPQKNKVDALKSFKRAAALRHDSYRIWQNVLVVAASLSPPDYATVVAAQKRVIDIRGSIDGETCIDSEILDLVAQYVISDAETFDPSRPGLARMLIKLVDDSVVPLITTSASLWRLVSKLALWRNKPSSALDAEQKAWRAVTAQPGWETESGKRWDDVVEATVRLCDSYESLGPKRRTEGLGADAEVVARDWKFKARSAARGILGRGKDAWEGTEGWERLQNRMNEL